MHIFGYLEHFQKIRAIRKQRFFRVLALFSLSHPTRRDFGHAPSLSLAKTPKSPAAGGSAACEQGSSFFSNAPEWKLETKPESDENM
jgi:hypothetical protein